MHFDLQDNKYKIIAAVVTLFLTGATVVVLILVKHFPPDPPIAERGVEVALGNTDFGEGDNNMPAQAENTTAAPQPSPATSQENVATQSTEETVSIPKKTEKTKPTEKPSTTPTETRPQEQPKKQEINKNALYPGNRNTSSGSGSGSGTGVGSGTGSSSGSGTGKGSGSGGGSKAGWSLEGRSALNVPEPKKEDNIFGDVVVDIVVDPQGKVIEATIGKGTTPTLRTNKDLCDEVIKTALSAKFNAVKDLKNAKERQRGSITYHYVP